VESATFAKGLPSTGEISSKYLPKTEATPFAADKIIVLGFKVNFALECWDWHSA